METTTQITRSLLADELRPKTIRSFDVKEAAKTFYSENSAASKDQKNLIDIIDLLLCRHNNCINEWGENEYDEGKLIEVIKPFNIGTLKFNEDGVASIDYEDDRDNKEALDLIEENRESWIVSIIRRFMTKNVTSNNKLGHKI